jgi:hypothetical protein
MKTSTSKSLFLVALLTSCNETPVKYYQCFDGEKNCKVLARFSDFETCFRYKKLASTPINWKEFESTGTFVLRSQYSDIITKCVE